MNRQPSPGSGRENARRHGTNIFRHRAGAPAGATTQPPDQQAAPNCNRAVSQIGDSARYRHPINSKPARRTAATSVDDFASKVELLRAGLGCGFYRAMARRWAGKRRAGRKGRHLVPRD